MKSIIALAKKDIRLLFRDPMAAFFVVGFPLLMGLFFGMMINNDSPQKGTIKVAVVDLDQSDISQAFVQALSDNKNLTVDIVDFENGTESVRAGKRVGVIVVPKKFGETAGLFWEKQPAIQLGVDPSRSAEGAMLEGFLMEAAGQLISKRFAEPTQFLSNFNKNRDQINAATDLDAKEKNSLLAIFDSLDSLVSTMEQNNRGGKSAATGENNNGMPEMKLATIEKIDVTRVVDEGSAEGQLKKVKTSYDISFPSAMLWGVLGCCASFAISIAQERETGTLVRLQVAPISRFQILLGKSLACFVTVIGVIAVLTTIGYYLGMRPVSFPKLVFATLSVAGCFVGIMMTMSTLGKSVKAVSSTGWAVNMVMAMFGGAMIPVMFMPEIIRRLSVASPVTWAINAIEGAIWRDFSWQQMALPCGILLSLGGVGLLLGLSNLLRSK